MGEAGVQKIGALIPRENNVTSSTDCEAHSTWSMVVLIRVMGGGPVFAGEPPLSTLASVSEGIPAQVRAGNPPLPPVLLLAWPKPACQSNLGG